MSEDNLKPLPKKRGRKPKVQTENANTIISLTPHVNTSDNNEVNSTLETSKAAPKETKRRENCRT